MINFLDNPFHLPASSVEQAKNSRIRNEKRIQPVVFARLCIDKEKRLEMWT